MAEAHEAVAFSFKVTEEGVDINFNKEALSALYYATKKSFKRGLARIKVIQYFILHIYNLFLVNLIHFNKFYDYRIQ